MNTLIQRGLIIFTTMMALIACGGGTGGTGGGGTSTGLPTLELEVLASNGAQTNYLAAGSTVTVKVTAWSASGAPMPNEVITIAQTSGTGWAVFSPSTGTALTNAQGIVTVDLIANASNSGLGVVLLKATATLSGTSTSSNPWSITIPASTGSGGANAPSIDLNVYSSGTAIHTMTPGSSAIATVIVLDSSGSPVANLPVKITLGLDTSLVNMVPASGNVLTDSSGVATANISAIAPSIGGTITVKASATVNGSALTTADWGISIGQASITLGSSTQAPATSSTSPLAANSTITVSVPVTSGGSPVSSAPITSFTASSTCSTQNPAAALITPVGLSNGIFTYTYKNLGCALLSDNVTVTMTGATNTSSSTVYVATAPASELRFISVVPSNASLVIKGASGLGTQESGTVSFKLLNTSGNGISGTNVNFSASTIAGGITLSSSTGVTDSNGDVSVTVYSGTAPTPVVVMASAQVNGVTLSATSSVLTISAGSPQQTGISFAASVPNIEGRNFIGKTSILTVMLNDLWSNPVPNNTAVSFISEGGTVSNASNSGSCTTANGVCNVTFTSTAANINPPDGRVTVTAYANGLETFVDNNGNGAFDSGEDCWHNGSPYIDANENGVRDSGETYIQNISPSSNSPKASTACATRNSTYVYEKLVIILSGSDGYMTVISPASLSFAGACNSINFKFRVHDVNNNPMAYQTKVTIENFTLMTAGTMAPSTVGLTTALGGTVHQVTLSPDQATCGVPNKTAAFAIGIESPSGTKNLYSFTVPY